MKNKNNFWDSGYAKWLVQETGLFNDMISKYIEMYKDAEGFICNFNKDRTAFFIRTETFAIRIGSKWGKLENCYWYLDKIIAKEIHKEDFVVVAKLEYKDIYYKNQYIKEKVYLLIDDRLDAHSFCNVATINKDLAIEFEEHKMVKMPTVKEYEIDIEKVIDNKIYILSNGDEWSWDLSGTEIFYKEDKSILGDDYFLHFEVFELEDIFITHIC